MKRRRLLLLVPLLIVAAAASPSVWRSVTLYRAKYAARKIFEKYPPEVRMNLNTTPARVVLPDFKPGVDAVETADLGDYAVRFPRSEKPVEPVMNKPMRVATTQRATPRGELIGIRLTYPRFSVLVRTPTSSAATDAGARELQFKDSFDMMSAGYHTRLDDLDAHRDLPVLERYLMLISTKPQRTACVEEFERADLRGFILSPLDNRTVVEVFISSTHAGCGVWFMDSDGLTLDDVHQFLAVLRFEPKPSQ